jgi:hypothetical protein
LTVPSPLPTTTVGNSSGGSADVGPAAIRSNAAPHLLHWAHGNTPRARSILSALDLAGDAFDPDDDLLDDLLDGRDLDS